MTDRYRDSQSALDWLSGGGEMGRVIREMDWSQSPLGPLETWPQSLRTTVSLCLASNFPISIAWGPERIQIYNDGYWPICGAKHPHSMGQDFRECWFSAWPAIGEAFERATAGETAFLVNQRMFLDRNGYLEETFFTFSFSPIRDETGGVGGLFHPVTELTQQSLAERRLKLLRDLADRTSEAKTVSATCDLLAQTFSAHNLDVPFALLYLLDAEGRQATLAACSGLEPGSPASPEAVDLTSPPPGFWAIAAGRERQIVQVDGLEQRFGPLVCGPYPEPPQTAFVLPINISGLDHPFAVLIAGVSSRRALDEAYRTFYAMLREAATNALTNARAYEEERKRAEALAEIDRAKTAFFSNVSHEFRTPLTLMLGPVEEILTKPQGEVLPENRELLEVVHRNALRLQKLVNSLLDFSRIEAGRVQASYVPADLPATTAELASVFRSAIERAGLRLVVECDHPLSQPAYLDREMWEKIVLNLLSNAFKFTFEGEICVRVREHDRHAILEVEDTGIGVPATELPRLFERFHRVENAQGRTHEGTGIGLALVQELVRLHGGTIEVESQLGEGTLFRVSIPLGRAHLPQDRIGAPLTLASTAVAAHAFVEEAVRWLPDEVDEATLPPLATGGDAAMAIGSAEHVRARIVLADDNADMRDYLKRLLAPFHNVEAVPDGVSALAAVRRGRPDLVLLDVMMPGLDGFEVLARLRTDPETTTLPVILLSARAGEEARIEGLERGADDYLTKPFSAKELIARVTSHLELALVRRKTTERLQLLSDSAEVLLTADDPDRMLGALFAKIAPHLGLDAYFNYMVSESGDGLQLASCAGIPEETARAIEHLEFGQSVCGTVALCRQPIVATHIQKSEDPKAQRVKSFGIRAYACNPLITDGRLLGTLSFASHARDDFDTDELEFLRTISHYVTAAYERIRLIQQLRDTDRRKDEFLAMLAHELRNPLAPIRTAAQYLKIQRVPGPGAERQREIIERQAAVMARLLDDLLDVSRITRGLVRLNRRAVDLSAVVEEALEAVRPFVREQGHELSTELTHGLLLDGDPVRLEQVVANLVNNAAKYTDPGGHIHVETSREGCDAVFRVIDNGIGIPAELLPHVFELFTQGERTIDRSQGGLGIGLKLVHSLVELHGGRVEAASAGSRKGSVFTVRLPLAVPATEPTACLPAPALREPPAVSVGSGGGKVLVIDDNRDGAEALAELLQLWGYNVGTANDGLTALRLAEEFRPQVVLLDIGMPGMDGHEVAKRMRLDPVLASAHLIALTGYGREEDRERARAAGFDQHLTKPVDPACLERLLRKVFASEPVS